MNIITTFSKPLPRLGIAFAAALMWNNSALSGANQPGPIATSPLFLQTSVEPNIFFILDDSGSMEWENMVSGFNNGLPVYNGWGGNHYLFPTTNNGLDQWYEDNDCFGIGCYPYTTEDDGDNPGEGAWRSRTHDYNALYYNPEVQYKPWSGSDNSGDPLFDYITDATRAPVDPLDPGGDTFDLTSQVEYRGYSNGWYNADMFPAKHYIWTDTDGDGIVDADDAKQLIQIKAINEPFTHTDGDRDDCADPASCSYTEEIQNFANWFTYYRKRKYVAMAAMGDVVDATSSARMGLQAYNDGLIENATTMSDNNNKVDLLDQLYSLEIPCGPPGCRGTPARQALVSVGDLFQGNNSPILASGSGGMCQQNFSVIIGDGFWNGATPGGAPGNADGDLDTEFDSDTAGLDGAGDKVGYGDNFSNTLADIAMTYYEDDLKPLIDDEVLTTPTDDAEHQHLVTYTVAFGVNGNLDPFDSLTPGDATDTDPTDAAFAWADPTDTQDADRIDDMWHAAYNGRGEFLEAQNPQQLEEALTNAFASISDRTAVAAAVSFDSTSLTSDNTLYQAKFKSQSWGGLLVATSIDIDVNGVPSLGAKKWSAHSLLVDRVEAGTPRNVITFNGSKGIAFEFPANHTALTGDDLSSAQVNDLLVNAPAGDEQGFGERLVDYILGFDSNEVDAGGSDEFRTREDDSGDRNILGDIIHSSPAHVGAPTANYPDDIAGGANLYSSFKAAQADRTGMVYVGSNDGGLHAFNENSGEEHLFYLPQAVFSSAPEFGLHEYADPNYGHTYYIDMTPTIADIYAGGWKTYLVGGLRGGGKGLYVLDVTSPLALSEAALSAKAASIVKGEFTHNDLGFTFSQPKIGLLNNGEWAAIFGNGYNAEAGDGTAKLFLLYLDGGADGVIGTAADDYEIIETYSGGITGSDCSDVSSNCNGLATPTVLDLNGDGKIDRVYAGDLLGQMWSFDLSSTSTASWQGGTYKLITATDGGGSPQPITVAPAVIRHPTEKLFTTSPNLLVFFGTGQYLSDADKTSADTQTFYGVWDNGAGNRLRSDLVAQTITQDTHASGRTIRTISNNVVSYSIKYGWYIDLPISKERVVVDPVALGDLVFFNSLIPSDALCDFGGSGWLMGISSLDGGPPPLNAVDINNDNMFDDADQHDGENVGGVEVDGLPTAPVFGLGPGGVSRWVIDSEDNLTIDSVQPEASTPSSRTSWTTIDL